ncbi:hypothetical protein SBDP2_1280007 [Syntrophobacter sp. SbD2]|nr:hypothetical protein SBDP2_1280007 [Syntrophobacter sp. SbD2]
MIRSFAGDAMFEALAAGVKRKGFFLKAFLIKGDKNGTSGKWRMGR